MKSPPAREAAVLMAGECACMPLRQAARAMSRIYDEALKPLGLQASQLSVLIALAHFPGEGAPMGALAEASVADRTTLTRALKPLEGAGLLAIEQSRADARARLVRLTRAGARTIERALPLWRKAQAQAAALAGQASLHAARDAARALTRKLRQGAGPRG